MHESEGLQKRPSASWGGPYRLAPPAASDRGADVGLPPRRRSAAPRIMIQTPLMIWLAGSMTFKTKPVAPGQPRPKHLFDVVASNRWGLAREATVSIVPPDSRLIEYSIHQTSGVGTRARRAPAASPLTGPASLPQFPPPQQRRPVERGAIAGGRGVRARPGGHRRRQSLERPRSGPLDRARVPAAEAWCAWQQAPAWRIPRRPVPYQGLNRRSSESQIARDASRSGHQYLIVKAAGNSAAETCGMNSAGAGRSPPILSASLGRHAFASGAPSLA